MTRQAASVGRPEELAYAISSLYASGAVLVVGTLLLLPSWDGRNDALLWSVACFSLVTATTVRLRRTRATTPVAMILIAIGSSLIAIAAVGSGALAPSIALFYIWVSLVSFYFFTPRNALLQWVFGGATHAVSLWFTAESTSLALAQWVFTLGTSLMAGVVVGRLVRRIGRVAMEDWLTGALNRRAWDAALTTSLSRASRLPHEVMVLMIDVDNFKELNDRLGHAAGDGALHDVVLAWQDRLRTGDIVARLGGDEFGVILTACEPEMATDIANRVSDCLPEGLTCSIGAARWDGMETPESLVRRADDALYEAKESGRDQLVIAASSRASMGPSSGP